jgi:uncharacterized membrane protein
MAQADLMGPPVIRGGAPKAKMNIYFALLIISLIAMLLACLFMYLEVRNFGGFGVIRGTVTAVERTGGVIAAADEERASLSVLRIPAIPQPLSRHRLV